MEGRPVWLASLTFRDSAFRIIPTETWDQDRFARAEELLDISLDGAGDANRQRGFRMCATICRHRGLTADEEARLPAEWWTQPARDLAGGPVAVLWSIGIPETPSIQPCQAPQWHPLDPNDPRLRLPVDCGECEPCRARTSCRSRPMERLWAR